MRHMLYSNSPVPGVQCRLLGVQHERVEPQARGVCGMWVQGNEAWIVKLEARGVWVVGAGQ